MYFALPCTTSVFLPTSKPTLIKLRADRTFLADETGYKRLVLGKKMTIILAQGRAYPEGSSTHTYNLQTPCLLIFGFTGITNSEFIYANGLNLNSEARNLMIAEAQAALKVAIAC
jgi:FMN-dependent NADH-azoreductase